LNLGLCEQRFAIQRRPSFVAHQYYIAGQSGGISGSLTSPDAEAENPGDPPAPAPTGDYIGTDDEDVSTSGCHPDNYKVGSVDMSQPVASPTPLDNGPNISPCEEYPTNILDEAASIGTPPIEDWQYIAHADNSIWAAPLGVAHLWKAYNNDPNKAVEPFAVDPDAEDFVLNITGSTNPPPNPARPIAALTYITPCIHESDHPQLKGTDDGPQWLAWVLNAIGDSQFWSSSVIFVVWDDWGGFYDNVPAPTPFRPANNKYGNPDDPNEWGFRVPLIVISPYLKERGFISSQATSGFQYRSQSVILQYIEATFGLPSLGTDDFQNNQSDGLRDMFNYGNQPLAWADIPNTFTPGTVGSCPGAGGAYRRAYFHGKKKAAHH
jgi:hypothetical protein